MGEEYPPKLSLPLGFCHPPEENRAMAISKATRTKNLSKIACGLGDMLVDRQTDTHRRAHYSTLPPLPLEK